MYYDGLSQSTKLHGGVEWYGLYCLLVGHWKIKVLLAPFVSETWCGRKPRMLFGF